MRGKKLTGIWILLPLLILTGLAVLAADGAVAAVTLSGLIEPRAGEKPSYTITADRADVVSVEWFCDRGGGEIAVTDADVFSDGEKYGCYITLAPRDGETFADDVDVKCGDVSARDVDGKDGSITAEFYFHKPEAAENVIRSVELARIQWPEAGMTVGDSIAEIEKAYVETDTGWELYLGPVLWYAQGREAELKREDVFEAGRTYLCWIRLDTTKMINTYLSDLAGKPMAQVTVNGEVLDPALVDGKSGITMYITVPVTMAGETSEWIPAVSYKETEISCLRGDRVVLEAYDSFPDDYTVTRQWIQRNADGEEYILREENGKTLVIPTDTEGTWQYYCMVSGAVPGSDTVYASRVTEDMPVVQVEVAPYTFPFADVPEDAWYRSYVELAHRAGLVNGMTENEFKPEAHMTLAECIKLAACMHQRFREGEVTLTNGSPWYMSYILYAREVRMIAPGVTYTEEELNAPVTRAEYVNLFCYAMPFEALKKINDVPDGSIPDVPMDHPYAANIYKMYTSGIINGSDARGTFGPEEYIQRSAVAAILVRMMDPVYRVGAPAELDT